ncbi:MAG: hypothetical protein SCAL_000483 [Candidatus Syntrophoarchaeum caldarius]|uniref:Transcriptional regulator n=1 Tax=Candidatus Syntropharchaeum caldarium TaxID=1838285 RepID=A0A1F2PBU9_9EURY|nr:MAG: hypothetical protein SCAL_000483 [Candidatus Syntrophoarchaeum caldarius]
MLSDNLRDEIEMFKRHIIVLRAVIKEGAIGILKLAEVTALPTHKVRYSLRILEREGLIRPSYRGAVATRAGIEVFDGIKAEIESIEAKIMELKKHADPNRKN